MKNRLRAMFAVVLTSFLPPTVSHAVMIEDSCTHYWPKVVELHGRLTRVVKYGPPNYGENPLTDQKYAVPILRLAHPIAMCKDSIGDPLRRIVEVQVDLSPTNAALFYNKTVRVKGTLGPASLGHDYTKVVMTADSIAVEAATTRRSEWQ